jgi:hypothetical protein
MGPLQGHVADDWGGEVRCMRSSGLPNNGPRSLYVKGCYS